MSDDGIIVRRAEAQGRSALLGLQAQGFRTHGRHHYGVEVLEAFLAHVGTLDPTLLEDRTYFLIEGGGEILACGGRSVRRPRYAAHAANDADPGIAFRRSGRCMPIR